MTNILAPTTPAKAGINVFEGDIIRSQRKASYSFFKSHITREAYYYIKTTETDDYVGRATGVLLKGTGGYYLEITRPKPVVGFFPGTLVPAFATDLGYVFVGEKPLEYFTQNFLTDKTTRTESGISAKIEDVTVTPSTDGTPGGVVTVVKRTDPESSSVSEPITSNTITTQPKAPAYALIGLLVVSVGAVIYLTLKKP